MSSYLAANARARLEGLLDPGSFEEFLPAGQHVPSAHLAQLNAPTAPTPAAPTPAAPDDGVVIGAGRLDGTPVLAASQDGSFMGGAVGEVHGAKLVGLLRRAVAERAGAVLLLLESGGARLHEANAGMIAISEVMRAVLDVRAAGIPVFALIGGTNGAFGGIGMIAGCANAIVISEQGRLAMSGPKVIETASGVAEFDSRDHALVWRTTGGKHRYLLGDCQAIVPDTVAAFRQAARDLLAAAAGQAAGLTLAALEREQQWLAHRIDAFGTLRDPHEIWAALGVGQAEAIPDMALERFVAMADPHRLGAK